MSGKDSPVALFGDAASLASACVGTGILCVGAGIASVYMTGLAVKASVETVVEITSEGVSTVVSLPKTTIDSIKSTVGREVASKYK